MFLFYRFYKKFSFVSTKNPFRFKCHVIFTFRHSSSHVSWSIIVVSFFTRSHVQSTFPEYSENQISWNWVWRVFTVHSWETDAIFNSYFPPISLKAVNYDKYKCQCMVHSLVVFGLRASRTIILVFAPSF